VDLKAGGEISDSKIGTTPHALRKVTSGEKPERFHEINLRDLPLNAELDTKGTSGKLAERIWDDPEWNEHSDEEDKDTKIERLKNRSG